jgi:hypothetical protein
MLPNLRELDISYISCSSHTMRELHHSCPRVSSLKCKGANLGAIRFYRDFLELTEPNVDNSAFHGTVKEMKVFGRETKYSTYLWLQFMNLSV